MERVLITGANRGLGLELTRRFVARGDRVFAGCRNPEKATALKEVAARHPELLTVLPLEVTDEESIVRSAAMVTAEVEGLDILFNNAAIFTNQETIKDFVVDEALHMLNVNAVGQMLVIKYFVDLLKAGKQSRIINITSEAGSISQMTSFRGYYYYGSKALLNMFSRALAQDPETRGIIVTMIHPGWVRTDMGGSQAHLSVTQSAEGLLKVTDKLTVEDNGKFFTWEGSEYPW